MFILIEELKAHAYKKSIIDPPKEFLNNTRRTVEVFTEKNARPNHLLTKGLNYEYKDGIYISDLAKKNTSSENERPRIEREYENKLIVAKALKNHLNEPVKVLPEIKPSNREYDYHFDGNPHYGKVPDLKVGENFWEVESYEGKYKKSKLWHMIKEGSKQADFIALKLNEFVPINNIKKQLNLLSNDKFNQMPLSIIIINKDGEVIYTYKKERK
ncbi:hypothetical protein [Bergeyella cardium]|uniref:tRNA nuclease CdiA C-terminal domain-containing protein n=1 Tax=Bergeyella cardium TaxID=1585976 RepID=A0A6P1QTV2_9FLAO|nr:hypothetical protein [Bergeyella cardium]QHN65562.1 hypothetical protein DBX24_06540 [Bergeyella cardium]WHE33147.1 hypothetical protein P8603_06580 [Bergeyella cardium]WHF59797.1 hypothetical protein O0R51_06580 [Bergeyella cardium]